MGSIRCSECPFYLPNAQKLNDWHLDEACLGKEEYKLTPRVEVTQNES